MPQLPTKVSLVIDGKPAAPTRTFPVIDPATGEPFAIAPLASEEELERAVAAARRAFPAWSARPQAERIGLLEALADALEERQEELATLLSQEQGKPLRPSALGELQGAVRWIRATVKLELPTELLLDETITRIEAHHTPLGVVASITPWNFPILIAVWHIAPALLTGNTVILKPSSYTPLTTLRLAELANGILPPGVFNSLTGDAPMGQAISRHPGIDKIVFTGSTLTGRDIMANAAGNLKRLTLELGGNDAAIVLPDVHVDKVAAKIFAKSFGNSGQVCAAIKRLYVHQDVHDELAGRLADMASAARLGAGSDPQTQFGPVQNRAQFDLVCALAEDARARGATFLSGGAPLERPGYFFPLTVVTDLVAGSRLVDEEQFGPILPIIRFRDVEDAIASANSAEFGLGGSVWSADADLAANLALRLHTGTAWVNDHATISPDIPFGGAGQSGLGAEFGRVGLEEYTQRQIVRINHA